MITNIMLAVSASVGSAFTSMQVLIFVALAVSGALCLGVAVIFGGHDHGDVGHHDLADSDGHDSAPSFLSPRVFFAFLVGFGVAGAIASAYGANTGWATGVGFIPGFFMAFIAWGVGYFLFKQQVNSNIKPNQVINCFGVVTNAIRPGSIGEVDVSVNGQLIPYNARSESSEEMITVGLRVRVIKEFGGQIVVRKENVA